MDDVQSTPPVPDTQEICSQPRRPNWGWFAALFLSAMAAMAAMAIVFSPTHSHQIPADLADFTVETVLRAVPGQDNAMWQPASLPASCAGRVGLLETEFRCSITLRIPFRHDQGDSRLWSAYLPSYRGEITVSLNGVFLATSSWQQPLGIPDVGAPMIVTLPAPVIQPGDNILEVALTIYSPINGFLGKVAIGPDDKLRPHYQWKNFLLVVLPRLLNGWQISMGLGCLLIWLARPKEKVYLLFGGVALFHAASLLPPILGGVMEDPWLARLFHNSRLFSAYLVYPVVAGVLKCPTRIRPVIFLLPPVAAIISYFTLPLDFYLRLVVLVIYPLALLTVLAAIVLVGIQAFIRWNVTAVMLLGATVVMLIFGVHDLLTVRLKLDVPHGILDRFGAPIFLVAVGAMLTWRFAQVMNALDRVNARISKAVKDAEASLRRGFDREQEQTRASVLEAERVRLMSDLHDGIAGQLVSILAQCELNGNSQDEVAAAVRRALADLRLVIASLEDTGDNVVVMLAIFRERIEPQLNTMGVALKWRMAELPGVAGLHPGATLNIFRILQEAVINAARHSGSTVVELEGTPCPVSDHSVRLTVRDHGRGGVVRRTGSYGLDNMRRRAEALGARLQIITDSAGTTVTLDLPSQVRREPA